MLTLVHPARPGQDPPKRKGATAPSLKLTEEEEQHVRAAIRAVAPGHGGLTRLAARLGVEPSTLRRKLSPGLAVALARVLHLSLDALLSGTILRAGTCPACGARPVERAGGAR
jgi:hypothetical protein